MSNQPQRRGVTQNRKQSNSEGYRDPKVALDNAANKPILGNFAIVAIAILIAISTATMVSMLHESSFFKVRMTNTKRHTPKPPKQVDQSTDLKEYDMLEESSDITVPPSVAEMGTPIIEVKDTAPVGNPTSVCAFGLNPRQGSIFHRKIFNNERFQYFEPKGAKSCSWQVPRVRTIPYVKCCTSLSSVVKAIPRAETLYDIVIITGDEYCAVKDESVHFRQYYSSLYGSMDAHPVGTSGGQPRIGYLPLGPRVEFGDVDPSLVARAGDRAYLFNFMGSLTSPSRKELKAVVNDRKFQGENFQYYWHDINNWSKDLYGGKYLKPEEYKTILLKSKFTLCPPGHNPDSYRIFEACEAGSIPIFVRDEEYQNHLCKDAYQPYVDAGAPFVFLESWHELAPYLRKVENNATYVEELQHKVQGWYSAYMENTALNFERVLMDNYNARMKRGKKKLRGN